MGIRFSCPSGHKLNVKEFLAGKRGVCPQCGAKFIIPTPSEVAVAQVPLGVGVSQSQSIEIAVAPTPNELETSAAALPSGIIPVRETEVGVPESVLRPDSRRPEIPVANVLPASIVAPPQPIVAPVGVLPEATIPSRRKQSRRNQILVSLLLLALVILLAGILIWVLNRDVNQTPAEKTKAADRKEFKQALTMTTSSLPMRAHSRVEV